MSNRGEGVALKILADFKFAHRGVDVRDYAKGETVETDDPELVEVATANGWAEIDGAQKPNRKAKGGAPENKATES